MHQAKAVCVARNYPAHAQEMGSPAPTNPVFFIKPAAAICDFSAPISLPKDRGECHYELELACQISKPLKNATAAEAQAAIGGYHLALDLTLRTLQRDLKALGHPWEMAKAWDGSLPLGSKIPFVEIINPQDCLLELKINGETRQKANTQEMITPVYELISQASHWFSLEPGDLVLTGTPAGVGPLQPGDQLAAYLNCRWEEKTEVL